MKIKSKLQAIWGVITSESYYFMSKNREISSVKDVQFLYQLLQGLSNRIVFLEKDKARMLLKIEGGIKSGDLPEDTLETLSELEEHCEIHLKKQQEN